MSRHHRQSGSIGARLNLLLGLLGVLLLVSYLIYNWVGRQDAAQARRYEQQSAANATIPEGAAIGGAFTLTNQDGKVVTEKDFRGKMMLLTFGYTYCPDVCPTKLQDISLALDNLGAEAQWVQPVFISVDPQRDTPTQMKQYVELYHNRIQGLTGTNDQVAAIAKAYKIYYKRAEDTGDGNYMMDHSTGIYLFDQEGKFLEIFGEGTDPTKIADKIKQHFHR
ncbi:MAG: SCO family protein [Alphaproteobacteria bacterium]